MHGDNDSTTAGSRGGSDEMGVAKTLRQLAKMLPDSGCVILGVSLETIPHTFKLYTILFRVLKTF